MYRTILVPLDGSKRAEAILCHVEELALRYQATVVFLRVLDPIPLRPTPVGVPPPMEQPELEHRRKKVVSYLAAHTGVFREKGIDAQARVVHGPVVEAIIDAAEREAADLIALASHGRTGLSRVFYGSVAAGVLHRVDRPLLLIRSRGSD
jgi:nucleotide-binding universal stress UspA family protein